MRGAVRHGPGWRRVAVAAVAAVVASVGVPGSASAYVPSGNRTEFMGPSTSYGYQEWTGSTGNLSLLRSAPVGTLASGYCLDSWFDWEVGEEGTGHFDPRVARSCKNSTLREASQSDGAKPGMRKAAACYGPNNNTVNPSSKCALASGSTGAFTGSNPSFPNNCARAWVISSGGTVSYYSGGNSTDCYS